MSALEELYHSFRFADAFDIALVAVVIYTALTWFKETTSRSVLVGIGLLTIIYFAARAFGMHMTVFLFQAVFAVLLVALVVVFQEDLRRMFERLATLGTVRQRLQPPARFSQIDVLVETAADFAANNVGALLVLKGNEPLDRHTDGGIPIDARISRPLLDSIFDPHSMGHDGAVVIQGDRIKQFAARLPLSKNLKEVGHRGTRHSAALGLSECSDALCIVVSEERGEISVAERGSLTLLSSPADLNEHVDRFCERHYPQRTKAFWTRLLRENARLKATSVLFACVAWYLMVYTADTIEKAFPVAIEFRNPRDDMIVDGPAPSEATVTLRGYQRGFNLLVPSQLKFSINLAEREEGTHRIELDFAQLRGSDDLDVVNVSPSIITVRLRRRASLPAANEPDVP